MKRKWRTRERSPPLPKIAHPSHPRLGRSHASTQRSAMPGSPHGGTALLITVSTVPGKLTGTEQAPRIYTFIKRGNVVGLQTLLMTSGL